MNKIEPSKVEWAARALGIAVGTMLTYDEFQKIYRAKAKEYHPDLGGDQDKFDKIAEATRYLKPFFTPSGDCGVCNGDGKYSVRQGFAYYEYSCPWCQ